MKRLSLNSWIIACALLGIALGIAMAMQREAVWAHTGLLLAETVGGLFIDLLKMVLVPLTFTSIAIGVANLQAHHQMHRVWLLTLLFSLITTSAAVMLGIVAANLCEPGRGLHLDLLQASGPHAESFSLAPHEYFSQLLHGLFLNPFAALAQGKIIPIVVMALLLGVALVAGGKRYGKLLGLLQEGFDLTLHVVSWIMYLAPFGIMALLAKLVATEEPRLLLSLVKFVSVVLGTTLLHGAIVLPALLFLFARMSPLQFFRGAKEALITAFATSSSSATMPVTLRCLERQLQVNPAVSGFVVPLGAHLNMDGTALYEAAAALFVANLCGIELGYVQQFVVCLMAMLVSIGAAGIPSAGMVTVAVVLQTVGLPIEALALLLPLDRPLDTLRTAVNVEGDMVTCIVVNRLALKRRAGDAP